MGATMMGLKAFANFLESEATEGFLEILLNAMRMVFMFDGKFRRNIEGFEGRYAFRDRDGDVYVGATFSGGHMSVGEREVENPNVTITFRDEKALMSFILSPKPDILGAVLRQDVVVDGNLNYLYKFAYMATRLQRMATGKA
jgi:hypothetical protein